MTSLLAPSARGWTVEPKFGTAAASGFSAASE